MDEGGYVAALEIQSTETAEVEREYLVSLQSRELQHVAQGEQGPPGRTGPPGGEFVEFIASVALGGHRAVSGSGATVGYATATDPESAERCVGVTLHAAAAGAALQVKRFGLIVEPTWAWQVGPVFLAINGGLTQAPPDSGTCLQIGVALDATTLDVRIGTPILLD